MMNMYPFFGFPPYYRNYNNYRRRPSPATPVVPPAHASATHATHAPKNSSNFSLHNFDKFSSKSVQKPYTPSNFSNNFSGNFNSNSNFGNSTSANSSLGNSISGNLHFDENSASKEPEKNNTEHFYDECFEILGLKLHFDDLLIMCILFFLYQEDVKDSYLYIALILLLLS